MKRVGIQGWGSEGDLRPLVALAARLRREGHEPSLVLSPIDRKDYGELCRRLDVPVRVVPAKMDFSIESLTADAKDANPTKLSQAVLDRAFTPYVEAMYEAALALSSSSDVVVGGSTSWYVKAAAIKSGTPFVSVDYYPGVVPSKLTIPPPLPSWRWFNPIGWALLRWMLDMGFRKQGAAFFATKGLPKIRHTIPDLIFSETLNLHAASPSFYPPAPDWSAIHQVCGELFVPEELEAWDPSPSLRSFLDAGEPPVLMSLGSMEHMAPERARDLLVASARLTNVRAIVQSKRSVDEGRDGSLYFLPWVPHRRILPRCSAMVHHGGAGTSHAALRAAKPSVVLPFIFEQKLWGHQLEHVGAAGSSLSFWKATPASVSTLVRRAIEDESLRQRAAELAASMAKEDGAGVAARLVVSVAR